MINHLEKFLSAGRDNAMIRFSLGEAYFKKKCYPEAINHLRVCLNHDPECSHGWRLLGIALAETGQLEGAIHVIERGILVANRRDNHVTAQHMKAYLNKLRYQSLIGSSSSSSSDTLSQPSKHLDVNNT